MCLREILARVGLRGTYARTVKKVLDPFDSAAAK
jgi:hypothetical protein